MTSQQKVVLTLGIVLIMLTLWEGWQPELKALFTGEVK
jgi:hypothetical protein